MFTIPTYIPPEHINTFGCMCNMCVAHRSRFKDVYGVSHNNLGIETSDLVWNGEGLPPIGVRVQYSPNYTTFGTTAGCWYEGKVIAYHDAYIWLSDNGIRTVANLKFRPIKSDREKAIEEMSRIIHDHDGIINDRSLGAIYDAGYRKVDK